MHSDSYPHTTLLASPNSEEKRRLQNLEAKRRQRARKAADGACQVTIDLDSCAVTELREMRERQRGPIEGFYLRALLVGARFLANAGAPRGRKVKSNGRTAERKAASADKSAEAIAGDEKDERARMMQLSWWRSFHGAKQPFGSSLNPRRDGAQGNVE